jgi:predicted ester cyclase
MCSDESTLIDRNKATVRHIHDQLIQGNLAVLDDHPALAPMRAWFPAFLRAFPDTRTLTEDLVAEGDRVAYRLVNRGTHVGAWRGVAPTGRELEFEIAGMYRFAAGRVVEASGHANLGDVMTQAVSPLAGRD